MDNPMLVTDHHHLHDRLRHRRCRPLIIMPSRHDPIEQLSPLAQLHHQMHRLFVLELLLQGDNARVWGKVLHDGDLSPNILDVDGCAELLLGDGLAGVEGAGIAGDGAEVGDAELAAAEFVAVVDEVLGLDGGRLRGEDLGGTAAAAGLDGAIGFSWGGFGGWRGGDVLQGSGRR